MSARRLGRHDHLCWPYDDPAEYRGRALEFLADGLDLGQRVAYVGAGSHDALRSEISSVDPAGDLVERGALLVRSAIDLYASPGQAGPEARVGVYAAATNEALAAGYTGFRVAAEATALVADAEQRAAFARYEHLVDRYMTEHPFSALCAYRRRDLGVSAVAELAAMHPLARPDTTPFQAFAVEAGGLGLSGEVDVAVAPLLRTALGRIPAGGGELVFDARGLAFIDHRGLAVIDEFARRTGAVAVLLGAPRTARLVAEIVGFAHLRVEARR